MRNPDYILTHARQILGERARDYGDFRVMSDRMATMMGAQIGVKMSPSQSLLIMAQLKMARLSAKSKTDSYLDAINYIALAWASEDDYE